MTIITTAQELTDLIKNGPKTQKIQAIRFINSDIKGAKAKDLAKLLIKADLTKLTELNLIGNHLTDNDFIEIIKSLTKHNLSALKVINFSGNNIGDVGFKAAIDILIQTSIFEYGRMQYLTKIQEINFSNNNLTDKALLDAKSTFAKADFSDLKVMNFSGNNIEDVGFKAAIDILIQATNRTQYGSINYITKIQEINFSNNKLTDKALLDAKSTFEKADFSDLKVMNFSGNKIEDVGFKVAIDILIKNITKIQEIDFSNNNLTDKAILDAESSFKKAILSDLKVMNFSGNNIGDVGFNAVIEILRQTNGQVKYITKIQEFNFSNNKIGNDGVKSLVGAFKAGLLNELQFIELSHNNIKDDGMLQLAHSFEACAIRNNLTKLRGVDLSYNKIGNDGVKSLAKFLIKTDFLDIQFIDLSHNNIGDDGIKVLATALSKSAHTTLKQIKLDGNSFGKKSQESLKLINSILENNNKLQSEAQEIEDKESAEAWAKLAEKAQSDFNHSNTEVELFGDSSINEYKSDEA